MNDDRDAYVAEACRSCFLSRTACSASRAKRGTPCCSGCDHREPPGEARQAR